MAVNAIRKAIEHKRNPFRPVVSKAGRRVLEFLAKHGERYCDGNYRETWHAHGGYSLNIVATTIEALRNRGLVTVVPDQNGVVIVLLSPSGRKYLEESK